MLTRESGYRRTMTACFLGYIVQATICTLAPLLYARFQTEYQIPLGRISLMITLAFAIQLLVDLAAPQLGIALTPGPLEDDGEIGFYSPLFGPP